MARKSRTVTTEGLLPAYRVDDAGYGSEPQFSEQPSDSERKLALVKALGWYARFMDRKIAKDAVLYFAAERGVSRADIKTLQGISEKQYDAQLCWLGRMAGRGLVLNESELARVGDHLKALLSTAQPQPTVAEEETSAQPRVNVQEIMRERAREAAGEIEGLFDGYLLNGDPDPASVNVVGILTERNILPQHASMITAVWQRRRAELESVQDGDALLKEGYSQYGKIAIRNMIKFCDSVLAGVASYATVKRAKAAPRKRRAVPVEKQVSKVKYCKTYKDETFKLDLTSLSPTKIVGATEVWAYDSQKRKLWYFVADSHVGTLGVKGTTITGFDTTQSGMKTLRKPGETIRALLNAGKPAARKLFKEIRSVQAALKGRTNENLVILRAA